MLGHVKSPTALIECLNIARIWDSRKRDLKRQVDSDARDHPLRCDRLYLDRPAPEIPCPAARGGVGAKIRQRRANGTSLANFVGNFEG